MFDIKALRAHIEKKFEAATVDTIPSPHIEIADFFPQEIYDNIRKYNLFQYTAGQEWIAAKESAKRRQSTPYHQRKQVDLKQDYEAAPEAKAFWDQLRQAFFEDNFFARTVYKKYPAYFDIRFGEDAQNPDFFGALRSMMFVQRHDKGYSIGPHTDSPNRVFTCIFSFPDAPGYEKYGTEFSRPKTPGVRCYGDLHHPFEDFEVVKVAAYKPNNFVLFFKTNSSFHAVREIDTDVINDRYGMQVGFYEPKGGLFNDLSKRGLLDDRTVKPMVDMKIFGKQLQIHNA